MGANSRIAWTDHTFNSHWGCTRVSPGCGGPKGVGGCYAETFSKRLGLHIWGPDAPRRFFGDKHWAEPLKWNRDSAGSGTGVRARVFVNSMSDTFEDRRDLDSVRGRLFELIEKCWALDWLLLTKRPQNIARLTPERWQKEWPENVWAGTTCEDQQRADERIPMLLRIPARVRFLSCEPLLGPLDIESYMPGWSCRACAAFMLGRPTAAVDEDEASPFCSKCRSFDVEPRGISWVICGGESGPHARPFDIAWARSIRDQCKAAGTAFFFKQTGARVRVPRADAIEFAALGSWTADKMGADYGTAKPHDRAGADPDEWPVDLRVREIPKG